jgi:hypothetical protein
MKSQQQNQRGGKKVNGVVWDQDYYMGFNYGHISDYSKSTDNISRPDDFFFTKMYLDPFQGITRPNEILSMKGLHLPSLSAYFDGGKDIFTFCDQ